MYLKTRPFPFLNFCNFFCAWCCYSRGEIAGERGGGGEHGQAALLAFGCFEICSFNPGSDVKTAAFTLQQNMDDEFEDFSVSSPFEALVGDIQEVRAIRLQLPLGSSMTIHTIRCRRFANGRCIQNPAPTI